jgi:hypothetical protein
MSDLLKITAATAILALGLSGANAAMLLNEDANGEKVVINTETQSETRVLAAEEGRAPATCPEGSHYFIEDASGAIVVVECVTETRYRAVEPGAATVRVENVPAGAFVLEAE